MIDTRLVGKVRVGGNGGPLYLFIQAGETDESGFTQMEFYEFDSNLWRLQKSQFDIDNWISPTKIGKRMKRRCIGVLFEKEMKTDD
jgi:hypothetical protein